MTNGVTEPNSDQDISQPTTGWRKLVNSVDWLFIWISSLTTIGFTVGRVIGFAFSFILARIFSTDDFGAVQYTITLANLIAIATVPFVQHVLPWYISRYKSDADELQIWLGNAWMILTGLLGLTIAIVIPLLSAIDRLSISVIIIFAGLTLFYTYEGLARGLLAPGKLVLAYIGSNIVQLIAVVAAVLILGNDSTTPALIIYGLSYFISIAIIQHISPFKIPFRFAKLRRDIMTDMLKFTLPIWLSHTFFQISLTANVLLLEYFWGEGTVGVYALTATIVTAFSFFPQGITSMLMPKIAEQTSDNYRQILLTSLVMTMGVSFVMLIGYILLYEPVVKFIGTSYFVGMEFALVMAGAAIIYTVNSILTSYFVGRKQPELETANRIVDMIVTLLAGVYLISNFGVLGAAYTSVLTAIFSTLTYPVLVMWRRSKRKITSA